MDLDQVIGLSPRPTAIIELSTLVPVRDFVAIALQRPEFRGDMKNQGYLDRLNAIIDGAAGRPVLSPERLFGPGRVVEFAQRQLSVTALRKHILDGWTRTQVAAQYETSLTTLRRFCMNNGISFPRRVNRTHGRKLPEVARVVILLRSGLSVREIAERFSVTHVGVRGLLAYNGLRAVRDDDKGAHDVQCDLSLLLTGTNEERLAHVNRIAARVLELERTSA